MRAIILIITFIFSQTYVFGQAEETKLKIAHLTGDFYIYTTYNTYQGNRIPANGMYLVTGNGVVMFDTPWDTTQFQPLLDSIKINITKRWSCVLPHTGIATKLPALNITGNRE